MPTHVEKRGNGPRPYKVVEESGRVVGSSATRANAQASSNVRNAVHYSDWKPTGKPKR